MNGVDGRIAADTKPRRPFAQRQYHPPPPMGGPDGDSPLHLCRLPEHPGHVARERPQLHPAGPAAPLTAIKSGTRMAAHIPPNPARATNKTTPRSLSVH